MLKAHTRYGDHQGFTLEPFHQDSVTHQIRGIKASKSLTSQGGASEFEKGKDVHFFEWMDSDQLVFTLQD